MTRVGSIITDGAQVCVLARCNRPYGSVPFRTTDPRRTAAAVCRTEPYYGSVRLYGSVHVYGSVLLLVKPRVVASILHTPGLRQALQVIFYNYSGDDYLSQRTPMQGGIFDRKSAGAVLQPCLQ